jgi:hypothetical protein
MPCTLLLFQADEHVQWRECSAVVTQVEFYRERRLRPMLKCANDLEMNRLGDILLRNLHSLFEGIEVLGYIENRLLNFVSHKGGL